MNEEKEEANGSVVVERVVVLRGVLLSFRGDSVGLDRKGRLLEYIAVEDEPNGWLIFHAMLVTRAMLAEVGLRR